MNVYFDYQIFCLQKYGGISRYFIELAKELNALAKVNAKIVAPYHYNTYLEEAKNDPYVLTFGPLLQKLLHNRFINKETASNEMLAKFLCNNKKQTILHETYYTNRFKVKCPRVITIHDMIYELFNNKREEEQKVIAAKAQAIREADCIIAVSENTKRDLIQFYPEAKNKTVVIHHGVDQAQHPNITAFKHLKPFFLHVGNRGWYKNFSFLLEVFAQQREVNHAFDLICFGGGGITEEEHKLLEQYDLKQKVKFISGSDDVLISLYKSAQALVYISNYEGFGMPLLEAMALGCPVICSNTSSLPEVYGTAALSINPNQANELGDALNQMATNGTFRKQLVEAGRANASKFTWKKCAQETLTVYNSLLH